MNTISLTVNEIADLARIAGLTLDESKLPDANEGEMLYEIGDCPECGILDDTDGSRRQYRAAAWLEEYPEEGMCGLGPEVPANTKITDPGHTRQPKE